MLTFEIFVIEREKKTLVMSKIIMFSLYSKNIFLGVFFLIKKSIDRF